MSVDDMSDIAVIGAGHVGLTLLTDLVSTKSCTVCKPVRCSSATITAWPGGG